MRSPARHTSRSIRSSISSSSRARDAALHRARISYKEVASELHISVKTVETHVSAVVRKLQLSKRYELTRWASDRRLV